MSEKLGEVFQRSELRFGGIFEDKKLLRRGKDVAETTTGGR
jgi:hypothetical protein